MELRQRRIRRAITTAIGATTVLGAGTGIFGVYASPASAAGTTTGTVSGVAFRDYNGNGTRNNGEPGESGIGVRAIDADGDQVGTATTAANGTYTLNVTGATSAQLRIEFVNIPAYLKPGVHGTNSGTSVQFVSMPATGVSLALWNPAEYCQTNPDLATPCYIAGDPLAAGSNSAADSVLRSFPDSASGVNDALQTNLATGAQIGATWGVAWSSTTSRLFSAAVVKRHVGLGPAGIGGIYATSVTGGTPTTSLLVDATTLTNLGTVASNSARGLPADKTQNSADGAVFGEIGKVGIGGLALSEDETTLWFVNLNSRSLVGFPVANPVAAQTRSTTIPQPSCTQGTARPWGIKVHDGKIYAGVVCTAENTDGTTADLNANVYAYDPAANTWSGSLLSFPLNYPKGCARSMTLPGAPAAWQLGCQWNPWRDTYQTQAEGLTNPVFPINTYVQPILSDIDFDATGTMIVALMDRDGMQLGHRNAKPDGSFDGNGINVNVGGDILRARRTGTTYTLESNANDGVNAPTAGAGNNEGPGGGEFYFQDDLQPYHDEIVMGGIAQLPGATRIAVNAIDPVGALDAGGTDWYSNTTGADVQNYQVYSDGSADAFTFGKAVGLGDIAYLCDAAPLEIGNRVWVDTNGNGAQDAGETPIAGVTVQLVRNGVVIGTAVTDADGAYYFGGLSDANLDNTTLQRNTTYTVQIPNATAGAGQQAALGGLNPTTADAGGNDLVDSDGTVTGTTSAVTFTTGGAGANDHSFDFGFTTTRVAKVALGNLVWDDTNDNGKVDAGEKGIPGVRVRLFTGPDCATEVNVGPDGILGTPDDAAGGMITDAEGHYLFRSLDPGDYCVRIDIPAGYRSSSDVPETANPNTDIDNDDNGPGKSVGSVTSNRVTLTLGGEPTNDTDGSDSNLTVDFGVFKPVADIALKKFTNGWDAQEGTGEVGPTGPDDTVHNPILVEGSAVRWTYVVTNTGNVTLVEIVVTDDRGVVVTCPKTTLAVGEQMTCTGDGVARIGQYANVATVNAKGETVPGGPPAPVPPKTDPSHYYVPPAISGIEVIPDQTLPRTGYATRTLVSWAIVLLIGGWLAFQGSRNLDQRRRQEP
ncbi:MAG: SdrD B-like domain-containing protein [Acidimicrobiia bacterium]